METEINISIHLDEIPSAELAAKLGKGFAEGQLSDENEVAIEPLVELVVLLASSRQQFRLHGGQLLQRVLWRPLVRSGIPAPDHRGTAASAAASDAPHRPAPHDPAHAHAARSLTVT